jgi:hypothetical protein
MYVASDHPRSLRDLPALAARRAMLGSAHMRKLVEVVGHLRRISPAQEVPDFDPLDGGVEAGVLFLFEKPGPKTSAASGGSGFISRNNDDQTAEATYRFLAQAGIPRHCTALWNVVPSWNGKVGIGPGELERGLQDLGLVLQALPNLHTIVLVGRKAQQATDMVRRLPVRLVTSAHPSPRVRARYPEIWNDIPACWARAASAPLGISLR